MVDTYMLMTPEDTYDITLISTIEVLLQKLRARQKDKKRLYRLEQVNSALVTFENMYEGCIPEEYSHKAQAFDDIVNSALRDLQIIRGDK
jgi:hypothetical protein